MNYSEICKFSIFVLTCVFCLTSFSNQKEVQIINQVIFSGKILNNQEKEITIYGDGSSFKKIIPLSEKGRFKSKLNIKSEGYFNFMIDGKRSPSIFLKPGDQLNLEIDINNLYNSLKYDGNASDVNNYLTKKFLIDKEISTRELYSQKANDFKNTISDHKKRKNDLLNIYKNVNIDFVVNEKKKSYYEHLFSLMNYEKFHINYTKNKNYKTPEGFLNELKNLDLDINDDFENFYFYKMLVFEIFDQKVLYRAKKDKISYQKAFMAALTKIKAPSIREVMLKKIAKKVVIRNEHFDELYSMIMQIAQNKEFKIELIDRHKKLKLLDKGKDSPTFDYENHKGGKTALADLKGKYVYIDIWATWCGPCIAEMPYLKKVKEQYKGKNIEFISISVDKKKDHGKWKQMIIKKQFKGIQLFTDRNFQSQFIIDYQVKKIPRFILIDTEGKIVNANAPRPSDPSLTGVFNELKI